MECTDKEPHGPFEARVFIQGVANYVPHTDGEKFLVLFPNQERYHTHPFPAVPAPTRGEPVPPDEVCDHEAVVQMDLRQLVGGGGPAQDRLPWTSLQVEGHWIGFESTGGVESLRFSKSKVTKGEAPGVPQMETLLTRVGLEKLAAIEPSVLPTNGKPDPPGHLVTAGVYLDKGVVSSASEFEGAFSFHEIGSVRTSLVNLLDDEVYSGVVKVELGVVEKLSLVLRAFKSPTVVEVPLKPIGDTLDVWIRHFCDLRPPDPERKTETGDLVDGDFRLNYLLRKDLPSLLVQAGNRLPIPRATATWLRGGPIGGEPIKCMGCGNKSEGFVSPFPSTKTATREVTRPSKARVRK